MDRNPLEKYEWYIKKFGRKQFDNLRIRAHLPGKKFDAKMTALWIDALIAGIEPK